MTFAELCLYAVLLVEAMSVPASGVSEDESGRVKDGYLIALSKLASLVAADDSFVDECAVAGQIFDYGDVVAGFGF